MSRQSGLLQPLPQLCSSLAPNQAFEKALAVVAVVYTFGLFGYFQPLPYVRPPVMMTVDILLTVLDIPVMLALMLIGYAFSMHMLMADTVPQESADPAFQKIGAAVFTPYKGVLLSAFEDDAYIFGRHEVRAFLGGTR